MKNKIIAMICLVATLLSMTTLGACSAAAAETWINYELSEEPDYSFAVIGDIQTLAWFDQRESTTYTKTLFDWILDNADERKIEYVFGLGDTIETLSSWGEEGYNTSVTNPGEWALTSKEIKRLDGVIPYLITRGNHDDEAGYHKYICTDAYKAQMDGFCYDADKIALRGNSMSNSYKTIEVNSQKYLMMSLDFDVNDDTIAWANKVISEYSDHRVIVATHAYNSSSGGFLKGDVGQPGLDDETDGDEHHDWFYFDGERLWDEIFSQHENMFMVLNGHVSVTDPVVQTRMGKNKNYVFEVLVDPQAYDERAHEAGEGAGAFVMLINFSRNNNKLEFEYISTTKDMHFKASNQFTKKVPGTSLLILKTTAAATTAESTSNDTVTEAPTNDKGCGSALLSTVSITAMIGTALATFAFRKKEND